jgi:hypothetical protein
MAAMEREGLRARWGRGRGVKRGAVAGVEGRDRFQPVDFFVCYSYSFSL